MWRLRPPEQFNREAGRLKTKHEYDIAQLRRPPAKGPCIRDTAISVNDVYRALTWEGLSQDAVIDRYPELNREDISAVKEFVRTEIQSRDHDEITGRPILPKARLLHGRYYKGRCRNATVARWNATENCFYYWREKFERIYIETIKCPTDETEPWCDVFNPVEELPSSKFEIPFDRATEFKGDSEDLMEFEEEMWSGWKARLEKRLSRKSSSSSL